MGIGIARIALVGVDGSGLVLMDDDNQIREVVHVSDALIQRLEICSSRSERVPCIDTHVTGQPVLEPDLAPPRRAAGWRSPEARWTTEWPRCSHFPYRLEPSGSAHSTFYRAHAGMLSDEELADALSSWPT